MCPLQESRLAKSIAVVLYGNPAGEFFQWFEYEVCIKVGQVMNEDGDEGLITEVNVTISIRRRISEEVTRYRDIIAKAGIERV